MEQSALKNSDVLIMCCLTQTPTANPDTMIGEFCVNTGNKIIYDSLLHTLFKLCPTLINPSCLILSMYDITRSLHHLLKPKQRVNIDLCKIASDE